MSEAALETVRLADAVYGEKPDPADPAELLHEASKLYPATLPRQLRGVARLARSPRLLASTGRAVRRHATLPIVPLPRAELPPASLAMVLHERRSLREFADAPLELGALAALLDAAYGVTRAAEEHVPPLRSVPSAGALYPLELYVDVRRVAELETGVYHYDPLARCLERQPPQRRQDNSPWFADEVADGAPAVVFVAAVFWRSRFKYGLRGYRFTLLEAGHVVQTLLLAATALGLGGVALGSFFDARVDAALGLNGVDESALIAVCLGAPA